MIVSFPDLYPDELFYSGCARYGQRMQYPGDAILRTELFGSKYFRAVVDLPVHLDTFTARLQPEHYLTSDMIIDHHTMMPFFSPFVPEHRVALARTTMRSSGRTHPGAFLYGPTRGVTMVKRLRFCIDCVAEDRQRFGETYWHRIHQVPGVIVCPIHATPLKQSNVRFRYGNRATVFVPAEQAVLYTPTATLKSPHSKEHLLLNIAKDSQWLLSNGINLSMEALNQRYSTLLADRGLAWYSGRLRVSPLIESFIAFFSQDLLRVLECEIDTPPSENWVLAMLRVSQKDHVRHPLHHLLMIHFLGYTLETFLFYEVQPKPFGDGPWICHNPFCHSYLKPSIKHVQITFSQYHARVTGTFACECGFVYNRLGPDCTPDDQHRIGKIITYGKLWESGFRRVWSEASLSQSEAIHLLSQKMETHRRQVYTYAQRLGLIRTGVLRENTNHVKVNSPKTNDETFLAEREKHRMTWLETLQQHPDAGITLLREKAPKSYIWLSCYDYEWRREHSVPSQQGRQKNRVRGVKDWGKIDPKLAEDVLGAATRIKATTPLIRVSREALVREVGEAFRIRNTPQGLLLTKDAIDTSIETHAQFLIRKIEYTQKLYIEEGIVPTKKEFILRSGLDGTRYKTLVNDFIDEALRALEESA